MCLLIKDNKILLALKKRGFGVGKWNGTGGKVEAGEQIVDAAVREVREEIGVSILNPEKVGVLHFRFPYKEVWNQDVHLFLAKDWQGKPIESDEMAPKWFSFSEIPYDKMWDDDKFWLPRVLSGEKINADFIFGEGEIINKHTIKTVEEI